MPDSAYRGLTIRIGADDTGLKKALQSSSSAVTTLQKELRTLQKASKLDSSDMGVFAQGIERTRDKALALTERLTIMRETLRQLKNNGYMLQVAEQTESAALKARQAQEAYEKVDYQIAKVRDEIAATIGVDRKLLIGSNVAESAELMKKYGASVQDVARYTEIAAEHTKKLNELNYAKKIQDIQDLRVQYAAAEVEVRKLYEEMARTAIANPAVTTTESFRELRAAIERADAATSELRTDISAMDKALQLDPTSMDAARLKLSSMQEQVRLNISTIGKLNEKLDSLRGEGIDDKLSSEFKDLHIEMQEATVRVGKLKQELDSTNAQLDKVGKNSQEFKDLTTRANELENEVRQANAYLDKLGSVNTYRTLKSQVISLSAETTHLNAKMRETATMWSRLSGSIQQFGWAAYSTITPVLTMFAYSAISSAEEVDTAYRDMRKTVQGTEEQFEQMRKNAIDFSRTHVTSADQILEIEAMGGQLGIATDKLEGFAESISNISIATDLDADTASEQLGQLEGILSDMSEDDFGKFSDALVRLGNNSATLESHISDVMLRIASMGTITGFTTPQLLAWSTAVASTGQGAEAAGTAISKTMSNIESAVGEGGDTLASFAEIAHMSSQQFKESWNTDPSGTMYAFIQGLKDIESSGGSADSALGELGINSVRQKQAILGLMQTIDGLNDSMQMSQDAWDGVSDEWGESGDAANEAKKKAEGFAGAIQLLRNNAQAFGTEVGDSLAPMIKGLASIVEGATQAYSELGGAQKNVLSVIAMLLISLGGVTVLFSSVSRIVIGFSKVLDDSKTAWAKVTAEMAEAAEAQAAYNSTTGTAVSGTKVLSKSFKDLSKSQKVAAVASVGLKVALSSIGIIAAINLVATLVGKFAEMAEHEKLVKQATTGLSDAIKAAEADYSSTAESVNNLADSYDSVMESSNNAIQQQADMASSQKQAWEDVGTNSALLSDYAATIKELSGKQEEYGHKVNLSKRQQVELTTAVEGYNSIAGTTYSVIDALTGKISVSSEELDRNTEAWEQNARAQAASEALQDVVKQKLENAKELDKVNDQIKESDDELESYLDDMRQYGTEWSGVQMLATLDAHNLAKRKQELTDMNDELSDSEEYYKDVLEETSTATDEATESIEAQEKAAIAAEEALSTIIEGIETYTSENESFANMLDASGMSAEELANKLDDANLSVDDLKKGIEDYSSSAQNALGQIETVSDITLDQLLANLEENTRITNEWGSNIAALYARSGGAVKDNFIGYIEGLGVEYAPLVQQLVESSDEKLMELATAYDTAGTAGANAYMSKLEAMKSDAAVANDELVADAQATSDELAAAEEAAAQAYTASLNGIFSKFGDGVTESSQQALLTASNVSLETTNSLASCADAAGIQGYKVVNAFALAIQSGATETEAAAQANAVAMSLGLGEADFVTVGATNVGEYSQGVSSGSSDAVASASDASKQTAEAFGSSTVLADKSGIDMAKANSLGIKIGKSGSVSAANSLSKEVASNFGNAQGEAWKSGYNLSLGMRDGINAGSDKAIQAAKDLAEATASIVNKSLDERSPSRVMKQTGIYFSQGYAIGIKSATSEAVKAASNMARQSVAAASGMGQTSMQASYANKYATAVENGRYAGAISGIGSNETINNYYSVDGLVINDNPAIQAAFETIIRETNQYSILQGGK